MREADHELPPRKSSVHVRRVLQGIAAVSFSGESGGRTAAEPHGKRHERRTKRKQGQDRPPERRKASRSRRLGGAARHMGRLRPRVCRRDRPRARDRTVRARRFRARDRGVLQRLPQRLSVLRHPKIEPGRGALPPDRGRDTGLRRGRLRIRVPHVRAPERGGRRVSAGTPSEITNTCAALSGIVPASTCRSGMPA